MKALSKTVLVLTLAVLLASPLMAADDAKKKKKGAKKKGNNRAVAAAFILPASVQLSADQQAAIEKLKSEYTPKLTEAAKKANSVMTPEQVKARQKALKAARDEGKKGKELQQAANDALNLTADQQSKMADARKEMASLRKEIRQKLMNVLTDDQKASLRPKSKGANGKKAKKKKSA